MALGRLRELARKVALDFVPLAIRKPLSAAVGRQSWIRGRYWYSMELVRDLAEERPAEFHRFLWRNHLAYAETYEIAERFGDDNLHPSRKALFSDLVEVLRTRGVDPAADIQSVFEVGCSMGYLLRYMETRLFPSADVLQGVDIDEYAVTAGSAYLAAIGSQVRIACGEMEDLAGTLQGRRFDLILCPGVLMYVPEKNASEVVRRLLAHTGRLLVLTGPAHPDLDNARLAESGRRERDKTFIHNLDRMALDAGGRIVHRRWEGGRDVGGNTIYWVFAEPAGHPEAA